MSDNNYVDVIQEEFTGDLDEFDTSQPPPVVQENEGAEIALARIAYRDKAIDKIKALRDYKCQQAVEWANREIIKIETIEMIRASDNVSRYSSTYGIHNLMIINSSIILLAIL